MEGFAKQKAIISSDIVQMVIVTFLALSWLSRWTVMAPYRTHFPNDIVERAAPH